jgi:hypothetical protein
MRKMAVHRGLTHGGRYKNESFELGYHVGDLEGTDSEDEFDRMFPITTVLREIGWNLTSLGKPLLPTVSFPIPAGGSAGGHTAQGLKVAKRKE